ncbi:MAG: diaminopropionate ammonia-lyase [Candidatus Poribacteria bacterium]|nr:diaminopropionate ammonia-lyase [Candidatus Poribacteria bacterium]
MNSYETKLFVNSHALGDYGSAQQALLNRDAFANVNSEVTSWPGYEPTSLIALNGLATANGVGALWCKHEGYRFEVGSFKPTGPAYAMLGVLKSEIKRTIGVKTVTTQDLVNRTFESVTREIVVSAATSGNHGRALAWGARMFGCRCVIYMSDGVSAGREHAIAAYGAEVVRVPGSYDRALERSHADAEALGYFVISDYESVDYPHVPRDIMQGYAMVADEVIQQFTGHPPPTHVFVPGGGGRFAGAICGHLWEAYGRNRPRLIVVEPNTSACLYQSAVEGHAVTLSDDGKSVMDGLVVGSASPQAWTILSAGAFAFLTIPDQAAIDAMRQASQGVGGDRPVVIGDTGIAAWAGFLAVARDESLRQQLRLDSGSRVVVIATEGATDPQVYEDIVGASPEAVLAKLNA